MLLPLKHETCHQEAVNISKSEMLSMANILTVSELRHHHGIAW